MEKKTGFFGKLLGKKKASIEEKVQSEQKELPQSEQIQENMLGMYEMTDGEVEARLAAFRAAGAGGQVPEANGSAKRECECGDECCHNKCSCGHKHKRRDPFVKGPKFSSTSPASKRQKAQRKARRRNRRK